MEQPVQPEHEFIPLSQLAEQALYGAALLGIEHGSYPTPEFLVQAIVCLPELKPTFEKHGIHFANVQDAVRGLTQKRTEGQLPMSASVALDIVKRDAEKIAQKSGATTVSAAHLLIAMEQSRVFGQTFEEIFRFAPSRILEIPAAPTTSVTIPAEREAA